MNICNIFLLLEKEQIFSNIDIQFAIFINSYYKNNLLLIILSLYLNKNTRNGHISLSLKELYALIYKEKNNPIINKIYKKIKFKNKIYNLLNSFYLLSFNQVIIHPKNNLFKPIILYKNYLFLYNVWSSVNRLRKFLINSANYDHGYKLLIQQNQKKIKTLFNNIHKKEKYKISIQQKHAILITLKKKITIITGVAGTGKTSLIKQIIKAIKIIYNKKNLLIYLVAPTGKATLRLINLLNSVYKKNIKTSKNFLINIENISTLHKRLQSFNKTTQFLEQYQKKLDLLIIDEASMVNFDLLDKVMSTILFSKTKLILIGDHYQLNAVESIGILRPIINWNKLFDRKIWIYKNKMKMNLQKKDISINLSKNIVILTNVYRFQKKSGIALLAKAIKENNFLLIKKIYFQQHKFFDICWYSWKNKDLYKLLINKCINYCKFIINNIKNLKETDKINFLSNYLNDFQILCLLNKGKVGTDYINNIIEYNLFTTSNNFWYNGKPIIILKNDKDLFLSNGEIGITIFNKLLKEWEVMFLSYNILNIKTVKLKDIKYYKPAWSITIHKAQGSEFNKVFFILPDCKKHNLNNIQKIISLITKELIYTAITRAKKKITIFASIETFLWGVRNQ